MLPRSFTHRIVANKSPALTAMHARTFFVKNKTVIMPQPPYSLDLASADFFFPPKLKTPMKEKRFAMIEKIQEKSKHELLTKTKSEF